MSLNKVGYMNEAQNTSGLSLKKLNSEEYFLL